MHLKLCHKYGQSHLLSCSLIAYSVLPMQMVQKTPALAAAVSSSGAPGCLRQFIVLEKGNVEGMQTGIMIAGETRGTTAVRGFRLSSWI